MLYRAGFCNYPEVHQTHLTLTNVNMSQQTGQAERAQCAYAERKFIIFLFELPESSF